MRRVFTIITALLLTFATFAQQGQNLSAVLRTVMKKYDVMISFSPTLTDKIYPKSVDISGGVQNALENVLKQTGFGYKKISSSAFQIYKLVEPAKTASKPSPIPEPEPEPAKPAEKPEPTVIVKSVASPEPSPDTVELIIPESQRLVAPSRGQFAVKTNLLYDATTTISLGFEMSLSPRWTLSVAGGLNLWVFADNKKWKHWLLQPEARYWFCESFNGGFVGFHVMGGQYNFGNMFSGGGKWLDDDHKWLLGLYPDLDKYRYQGWYYGGGLTLGYQWPLSRHWNFETSLGLGYLYMTYDKYHCPQCGVKVAEGHTNYVGPTNAALSLIYMF